jgi:hypothetical protein
MNRISKNICFAIAGTFILSSCNLDEHVDDTVLKDTAVLTAGSVDPATALGPILNSISSATQGQDCIYALQEHTSDELMPPVRGTDWYDFGVWTSLDQHQWDPSHPQLLNAWNDINQGITRANQAIVAVANDAEKKAQARFLRAYLIWQLVDLFGQVPFRPETDINYLVPPEVKSRVDGTAFVISELNAAIPDLKPYSTATYGLPAKEAAYALLARVYLNKFIYEGSATASNEDMQKVLDNVALIEASGFSLAPGAEYFSTNFGLDNQNSPETIWALKNESGNNSSSRNSLGSRYHAGLHYNHNPGGWNGFVTIADFYNKFDKNDLRFQAQGTANMKANTGLNFGFVVGQQKDKDGNLLKTRGGAPLILTVDCPLFGATEEKGVRIVKYEIDFTNTSTPTTDFPVFRYADVLLMKAEAFWRKGDDANALIALNELRANRNPGAAPITSIGATTILDERGFELYQEIIRRTDQVRFGTFTSAWTNKVASDPSRNLFPIPQTAVDSNPNLKQNTIN